MKNSVYDIVLEKTQNSFLKEIHKEKLLRLLEAIMSGSGKIYVNEDEYITLASPLNGGMNTTGFRIVQTQGYGSSKFRNYINYSYPELIQYYNENNAAIERSIAKVLNAKMFENLKKEGVIDIYVKKINEITGLDENLKQKTLQTLLALKSSQNYTFYLITANEKNNFGYEEYLITGEKGINLIKHTIADGSNGIKDICPLNPTDLVNYLDSSEFIEEERVRK